MQATLFQFMQTIYWSGLATWFGAALFIAVAAPVVFRVVREHDPTLPAVLSVNLDAQHSTLLASTIVARIMQAMTRASLTCAAMVFVGLVAQVAILRPPLGSPSLVWFVIRATFFLAAVGMLIYDWRGVSPRLFHYRQEYIEHADNPDVANAAKDHFDRLSRESVNVLFIQTLLLLGLILASANISFQPFG